MGIDDYCGTPGTNVEKFHSILKCLVDEFNNGDMEAGDLASSFVNSVGIEWI